MNARFRALNLIMAIVMAAGLAFQASPLVFANNTTQTLPFSQNWTNIGLISTSDDWSGVPGIIGYRGDDITLVTGTDPQTLLSPDALLVVDVNANQTNPNTYTTGGVTEFEITNPVVAMQGSGTADAPYLLIYMDTTGKTGIQVSYNVRDIDGSTDNSIQQVALHYRVGDTGSWTNIPAGYIADASTGPSLATLVTPISVTLPASADNQSLVQVRVMTTNAIGNDEWVGVDDISITGSIYDIAPTVTSTVPTTGATNVAVDATLTVNFSEPVTASGTWATLFCNSLPVAVTLGGSGSTYTINPDADLSFGASCTATVVATQISDLDGTPTFMATDYVWGFGTVPDLAPMVSSTVPTNGASGVLVDSTLTVNFSEPVTATGTWGTLTCNSLPVTVTLGGGGSVYTIDPDADLPNAVSCTATVVATQVTDLDGSPNPMATDHSWSFNTAAADVAPTVVSTVPDTGAMNVAIDSNVTITFSEPVTLTAGFSDITCATSGTHNTGTVDETGDPVIVINPDSNFTRGESCTATIDHTKVYDEDGTATMMAADHSWSFTILPLDSAPAVSSTVPLTSATGVALDEDVTITFTEAVDVATDWASITCATSGTHATVVSGGPTSFTLNPDVNFSNGELCTVNIYQAKVTDQDTDDPPDPMAADYSWSFTTLFDPAPTVTGVTPLNAATGVALNSNLTVTFSEAVDLAAGAVSLSCAYSGVRTTGVSTTDNLTFTIDPDVDLPPSERCTATLESTLITDQDTNDPYDQMAADYSWYFKTYYNPDAITPIGVARAYGQGFTGTIQGNVTLTPGVHASNSFSIQDDTGGIYVYPAFGYVVPTMALGDVVKVKGSIPALYHGLIEFTTLQSVTWISAGTVPPPLVTATNAVAPTQGKLIQVQGTATWTGTPPAPGTNTNFTIYINDGSGQVAVYVYKMTNIDLRSYVSGQQMRIIGISDAYDVAQVKPRYQSDIIDLRPPTVSSTVPLDTTTGVNPYLPISATFNKAMDPDSLTGNFTIGGVTGSVSYTDATHTAVFTPASHLAANTPYTATLNTSVTDSYGIPLAAPYSWSFTTGDLDTTPPTIVTRSPLPGAVDVPVSTPVSVAFSEELATGSQNLAHFILTGPYGVVPAAFNYNPANFTVTLTPTVNLLYSTPYTMTVTANTSDYAGNPLGADDTWTFTTMAEPPMQVYWGDLHNHTSYSDGSGTPTQALAAGKAAGFDFMAISDHSYAIDDGEWANTLAAVEAATGIDFVALRGFEYTQGAEGHINVYNTVRHAVRANTGCSYCDYTPNLEAGSTVAGFYNWMASTGTQGLNGENTLMQFNHPGWINFNDWFYHPDVNALPLLEEVGNGNGSSYVFSEDQFIRSLDYGWKVGATNNADTHSTYWGTNTDDRTGVVMAGLTKSALLEALRARRTFATEDKNASLTMKANGSWMGSEIANTLNIQFLITGGDTDAELASKLELITDQGEVAASTTPTTSSFTWEPELTITTGVHYFYVKVTQMDGDRIVSSPVWTMGSEDIAITDITIQPTVPTTHNPSLLTVRVTNRVAVSRTINVGITVDGLPVGTPVEVIVPANGDGYANFSWQPLETGSVTVTAELTGAPAGDNPDDNTSHLHLDVTDQLLPLILIDAGHGNLNASGNDMKPFIDDLSAHHYNVLKHVDSVLTAEELNPSVVKLLIITAPETAYTSGELTAIGNFVNAGGSLWMLGISDYTGSTAWASTAADRENAVLAAIETATAQTVNMRFNDDEVIDADDNNGYIFGVWWKDFPAAATTGIGMNVESISTWSLNSIVDRNLQALTAEDTGVQIVMQGDLDTGYTTTKGYNDPNHTAQQDADNAGDAYIYNASWVYPWSSVPSDAVPIPGAAVVDLTGTAGRIMLYGDSNDPFTIFAYTAGDGKQNELFNLQSVMWLLGDQLEKSTIAEARAQADEDQPDNLGNLVWVEGEITAAYGEFFNVLYVQDATGGITVHAPSGDIDPSLFTRGTHVRVIGTVDIYDGDTELQFFEAEMVQVITGDGYNATPLSLTTANAALESNQGWLTVVSGTVISKSGTDTMIVDDGSGPVRVFLDGYNGNLADIYVDDQVQVTGLISEDGDGGRIRVRNHNFHVGVPDDIIITFVAPPDITALQLLGSLDNSTYTPVYGTIDGGYIYDLDPALAFQYLDAGTYSVTKTLADGYYGFYLNPASVPAGFFAYWDAKGVNAGASGGWQAVMWQIINGNQPMFYLKVAGSDYSLIDGMTKLTGGGDTPLKVTGDYPLGTYQFTGQVTDIYAGLGTEIVSITFEALPDITALELLTSVDGSIWKAGIGTIDAGYTDYINPKYEFQYLDAGTFTVNKTLADGYYGFNLDETAVPSDFFTYWAAKGVILGATGWQGIMWEIINGNLPMFYLVVDGADYYLIDGLQYIASYGVIEAPLRVSGDYPLGTYSFKGTVEDLHYGLGVEVVTITFDRLNLYNLPIIFR